MDKLHFNHGNMLNGGVSRKRKIDVQRLRQSHQIIQTFQTMKNRLGTQIIFFESDAIFDPLHKRTHIFIYFQHIGQMLNIAITQALL